MGRRRLDQRRRRLKNHLSICGYGRNGRVLVRNLRRKLSNLVVVDNNPHLVSLMEEDGVLYIAIAKATGEMLFNPSFEALSAAGDTLIAVGEESNRHALAKDLSPGE